MVRHTIRLVGPEARAGRVSIQALRALSGALTDVARRSLRLRVEGRSSLRRAAWLDAATDIALVGLRSGSTILEFEAPALGDAAPQIFEQLTLWDLGPRKEQSAIGVVEETLRDALLGNRESDLLDPNTLRSVVAFRKILDSGLDAVILNGNLPKDAAVEVTGEGLATAERLRVEAPPAQRVIVTGELDTLPGSKRAFRLLLSTGQSLRGVLPPGDPSTYASLFTHKVSVDGEAIFRPSGALSRIVARAIRPAGPGDAIWERVPQAPPRSIEELVARRPSPPGTSGMDRVFGKWPGDESDEEILAALEELS